jgi:hypothetical protein
MWLERNGQWIERDSEQPWVTKGYTVKTDQERADYLVALQAAADAAAAQEAAQASLPAQFSTGVAVQDANGHWQKLVALPDEGEVVPVQISNSPPDPVTATQMEEAGKAARRAQRQLWRTDLRTIKTNMIANIDAVQAIDTTLTTAAGQQDQIRKLRTELIDIAKEVQALRKVVAEQTKGD